MTYDYQNLTMKMPLLDGRDCGCGAGDYEDDEDDVRTFDTDFDDFEPATAQPEAWPDHIEIPAPVAVPEAVPSSV
jgi:hypothetical protein